MAQPDTTKARWRTTVLWGPANRRPGFYFYEKLTGAQMRCPKCGQTAGLLYRRHIYRTGGVAYHMKCQSCHEKTLITVKSTLVTLLTDVLPSSDVQDLLR
jgi:hypothetical protein